MEVIEATEPDRMGNDAPVREPIPPIKTAAEIEHLRIDAEEAGKLVNQLKSKQQEAIRMYSELDDKIKAAEEERDKAVQVYYQAKPKTLPKEWTHDQMMAAVRKQCPGRDEAEMKRIVGMLGASQRGALAGEGIAYQKPLPPIDGQNVRDVDDHIYNIPPLRKNE
jgi:hypothetical protein